MPELSRRPLVPRMAGVRLGTRIKDMPVYSSSSFSTSVHKPSTTSLTMASPFLMASSEAA